jgi:hypothetical protein
MITNQLLYQLSYTGKVWLTRANCDTSKTLLLSASLKVRGRRKTHEMPIFAGFRAENNR